MGKSSEWLTAKAKNYAKTCIDKSFVFLTEWIKYLICVYMLNRLSRVILMAWKMQVVLLTHVYVCVCVCVCACACAYVYLRAFSPDQEYNRNTNKLAKNHYCCTSQCAAYSDKGHTEDRCIYIAVEIHAFKYKSFIWHRKITSIHTRV